MIRCTTICLKTNLKVGLSRLSGPSYLFNGLCGEMQSISNGENQSESPLNSLVKTQSISVNFCEWLWKMKNSVENGSNGIIHLVGLT